MNAHQAVCSAQTQYPVTTGLLDPLTTELENSDDLLACMAALQLVKQLAEQGSMSPTVLATVTPFILRLIAPSTEEVLLFGALDAAAVLLPHSKEQAQCEAFLSVIDTMLQVRTPASACVWPAGDP